MLILVLENLGNFQKPKNDTVCFLRWFPAWECCHYLVFRAFLGPSKTGSDTQFHAFFMYKCFFGTGEYERRIYMYHNYEVGNIVRLKSDGQIMKVGSIRENPFDGTRSGYIVCQWEENKHVCKKTFHVDDIEFVSVGDMQAYDMDNDCSNIIW